MRDLLLLLARGLVDRPEEVFVDERFDQGVTVLELEVAPEDRGAVIGRAGSTANALRVLLSAAAHQTGRRCRVEIRG